jgi:signal transduction histidine kinase
MNLEIEKTDLAKITRDVVERFEPQITESKCKISILGDTRVPGEWDRVRIEQVVTNLLSNAIKYGNGKPVDITVKKMQSKVQFTITDNGIGIPPEHQKRVFSRFERGIPTREYEGLGVGLYIVSQIIHHHKGTIKVNSELGKGTTFTILLPLSTTPSERNKTRDGQVIQQRI